LELIERRGFGASSELLGHLSLSLSLMSYILATWVLLTPFPFSFPRRAVMLVCPSCYNEKGKSY
jgi:hypothetical protein